MPPLPEDQNEEDQNTIPILIILDTVEYYFTGRYEKIPCRPSSLSGNRYITELLLKNHPRRVQEVMRMSLPTLRQLESFCWANTKLHSSGGVGLSEKLAMFIDVLGHGASNREVQEQFQHYGSTKSLCFQESLAAMLILHVKYVHQPQLLDPTSNVILQNQNTALTLRIPWALWTGLILQCMCPPQNGSQIEIGKDIYRRIYLRHVILI